jgi:phytoene dehydrogenase-like protein
MPRKYDYDAIIIGAGISGLVCGCYLAKAGMKTLIVEKNKKPGGYCTSFTRGGFLFDACVHSLGSLRTGGSLRLILQELDLEDKLTIKRFDPSDVIITQDHRISFWNDLDNTIQDFQDHFPGEADKIKMFFEYINDCNGLVLGSLRSVTFQTLLDRYFEDDKLKAILSLPLLGNGGLPAKKISALTGITLYKEFMFDGGYYPDGSIQSLADALFMRFKDLGGSVCFSREVRKVKTINRKIKGVEIDTNDEITSNCVVSSVDSTQAILSLLGKEVIDEATLNLIKKMEPSLSAFILYLGLDNKHKHFPMDSVMWYMPDYGINKVYDLTVSGRMSDLDWFLSRLSSDNNSLYMFVNAPFKNAEYWESNKEILMDFFIKRLENVYPDLASHIVYRDAATPRTLHKWTLNYKGAAYGWARVPSQTAISDLYKLRSIDNMYMTGHWTTLFQGVGGVAYLGRDTSKKILRKEREL